MTQLSSVVISLREASGAGNCLGVTPSMYLWPSGMTMIRWNVTVVGPPSESEACSVVGSGANPRRVSLPDKGMVWG